MKIRRSYVTQKQTPFTIRTYLFEVTVTFLCLILLADCASLPGKEPGTPGILQEHGRTARLATIFDPAVIKHSDDSGFILLRDGDRALRERLYLADIADHSIDVQYYIWNRDMSGKLLARKLIEAADRGVSVRILLDDFSVGDRSELLLTVNSHANIQIRVYNPFVYRAGAAKWLNFAFDFERLNRRMHNKTYSVDGVAAIVGGRNIGDEYFNHNENLNFIDLDLFTVGSVVRQVSRSFQEYWASPWAIAIDRLVQSDFEQPGNDRIAALVDANKKELAWVLYSGQSGSPESHFAQSAKELVWAPAMFIYDQPGGENNDAYQQGPKRVASHLLQLATDSDREILLESAYFVLDESALALAARLREKGVEVRALTNSMASNDVLPNHTSYAMVREDILRQGIELHELRPDALSCLEYVGQEKYCDQDSFLGLHAKAAIFDRKTVYVGSCNLNLRSAYLNTEAGMFIESPLLAEIIAEQIESYMTLENSWRPILRDDNVVWVTKSNGKEEIILHEPQTSWLERVKEGILTLVPGAQYY